MNGSARLARVRDFLLASVGGACLFVALVLVFLRVKFPGVVEAQFGDAFWGYLAGIAGVTVLAAAIYALSPPPR